jgi:hypothetical protein
MKGKSEGFVPLECWLHDNHTESDRGRHHPHHSTCFLLVAVGLTGKVGMIFGITLGGMGGTAAALGDSGAYGIDSSATYQRSVSANSVTCACPSTHQCLL